jgi:uncharacterized protein YqgC (DUF456 family)
MPMFLLVLSVVIGLILIPFGLPGLWVMIGAAVTHHFVVVGSGIGVPTLIGTTVLGVIAEVLEFTVSAGYTRKYGGSTRAAWGAIVGGIVGAVMGVPIPIIGSVIGAFVGSFAGALLFEYADRPDHRHAARVAWGALVGRAVSAAIKVGIGVAIAAWIVIAAVV